MPATYLGLLGRNVTLGAIGALVVSDSDISAPPVWWNAPSRRTVSVISYRGRL
jgi:hypothetical protein